MWQYSWEYTINHNENDDEKEKRSHKYVVNRSWHGHKYSKYKKCLSMIMVICIKHYQSNIWSSIHKKVKEHWGWVEKKRCL